MKLVRVGSTVLKDGKTAYARFFHGLWYREIKTSSGTEHEPCSDAEQKQLGALPDSRELSFSEAECLALKTAMTFVEDLIKDDRKLIQQRLEEGLQVGLVKYGPYNPKNESRDLLEEAIQEARDLIVYCAFLASSQSAEGQGAVLRKAIRSSADILVQLQRAK